MTGLKPSAQPPDGSRSLRTRGTDGRALSGTSAAAPAPAPAAKPKSKSPRSSVPAEWLESASAPLEPCRPKQRVNTRKRHSLDHRPSRGKTIRFAVSDDDGDSYSSNGFAVASTVVDDCFSDYSDTCAPPTMIEKRLMDPAGNGGTPETTVTHWTIKAPEKPTKKKSDSNPNSDSLKTPAAASLKTPAPASGANQKRPVTASAHAHAKKSHRSAASASASSKESKKKKTFGQELEEKRSRTGKHVKQGSASSKRNKSSATAAGTPLVEVASAKVPAKPTKDNNSKKRRSEAELDSDDDDDDLQDLGKGASFKDVARHLAFEQSPAGQEYLRMKEELESRKKDLETQQRRNAAILGALKDKERAANQELAALQTQNQRLAESNARMSEALGSCGKDAPEERKAEIVAKVNDIVRKKVFLYYQFIESKTKLVKATKIVADFFDFETPEEEASFIRNYRNPVNLKVNQTRGYHQKVMRDEIWWFHKNVDAGVDNIPTLEEITNWRALDIKTERGWKIKKFVWTRFLPAAVGKAFWDKSKFYDVMVSDTVKVRDEEGRIANKWRIPLGSEAFMIVAFENIRDKLVHYVQDKIDGVKRNDKYYNQFAKFSEPTNGRKAFGGWSEAGLKRYQDLKQVVLDNRSKNYLSEHHCPKYNLDEREILDKLRAENPAKAGIVEPKKSRKKAKLVKAPKEDIIASDDELFYSIDDDLDEDEYSVHSEGNNNDDSDGSQELDDDDDDVPPKDENGHYILGRTKNGDVLLD